MMADKEKQPEPAEPAAWDRVGQFLQDMADVSQVIARRNLDLWEKTSQNLRGGKYTADEMTTDAAAAMNAAMDNLEDAWTFWTRPPDRQRVATTLPTVSLFFSRSEEEKGGQHSVDDPVWIRVPFGDRQGPLPAYAEIDLEGNAEGVAGLKERLRAVRKSDKAYLLETSDEGKLVEGVYFGLISVDTTALASLRIVVRG